MNNSVRKINKKTVKFYFRYALAMCMMIWVDVAYAKLPVVEPIGHKHADNWLYVIKLYMQQSGRVIGLALSMLSFIWIAYAALAKFNQCRLGKAEWAELGVLVITGAAVLVFLTLLLTTSSDIIDFKTK